MTENKETKLIIAGREFEVIKYSGDENDKWYIGELGLMIEKKIAREDLSHRGVKRGEEYYIGWSSGREESQLEKLIFFAEWDRDKFGAKMQVAKEEKNPEDFAYYQERLERAKKCLEELKSLHEQKTRAARENK